MSKILICSIGSGSYDKNSGEKTYRPVEYQDGINQSNTYESAYVYDALLHFRGFDKCIFVGTCGSQWHMFYEHLFRSDSQIKPALAYDEDYFWELYLIFEEKRKFDLDPGEMRMKLAKLQETIGDQCADIIVMKYGLNAEELLFNFNSLSAAAAVVNDGDSVSFDITHSFRSLAIYELLAVEYFKDSLGKKITLDFVSYGMYDFSGENNGRSPIVNLSPLLNVLDWIKAAEEFNRYGTAYLLSGLLEQGSLGLSIGKEEIKTLRRLSGTAVSTNDLAEFKKLIKTCNRIVGKLEEKSSQGSVVFGYIFKSLSGRFGDKLDDEVILRCELAKWHYEKNRYMASAMMIVECILDYCARLTGFSKDDKDGNLRLRLNNAKSSNCFVSQFIERYHKARIIRNTLSHGDVLCDNEVKELEVLGKHFYTVYNRYFKDNQQNIDDLITAIKNAHV